MKIFSNIQLFFDAIINPKEYKDIGNIGERQSYLILKKIFNKDNLIRNAYIQKDDKKYTEIDIIAIGQQGIYIIESKNYSGWIFGNEKNKSWVQFINKNKKTPFYNPIWQNKTHIKHLKNTLKDFKNIKYYSIIVFSERCTLKKISYTSPETYVIKRDKLKDTIKKIEKEKNITKEQQQEIAETLSKTSRPDKAIQEQHVKEVKLRIQQTTMPPPPPKDCCL